MAKLEALAIKLFGPGAIMAVLKNEDPTSLGKEVADLLEQRADNNLGDKNFEKMKTELIPWFDRFYVSFRKELMKNG